MKRLLREEAAGQSLALAVDWHETEGATTGTVTGEDGSEFYAFVHEVELED